MFQEGIIINNTGLDLVIHAKQIESGGKTAKLVNTQLNEGNKMKSNNYFFYKEDMFKVGLEGENESRFKVNMLQEQGLVIKL